MSREATSSSVMLREADVLCALDGVRARLRGHGGDVEVRGVEEGGVVHLAFTGACRGCTAIGFTFVAAVEPALRALPGVTTIRAHGVHLSPHTLNHLRRALNLPHADPSNPDGRS